ncbi:hypothetical protein EUGRSUZ_A00434 [Eucalyptus grandis]|uniref:Uncharacterized protein n=2 Tax=Eucalyptus grandis TaxID=71139 RepID=A0ACC3M044_EUCGR|nr:hypothetical protein EUGRSUZ_A00434 [Eucalyptus grandis]
MYIVFHKENIFLQPNTGVLISALEECPSRPVDVHTNYLAPKKKAYNIMLSIKEFILVPAYGVNISNISWSSSVSAK